MNIVLQLKNAAVSMKGSIFRTAVLADMTTIENTLNAHQSVLDASNQMALDALSATSASSVAIGTGAKTFTATTGKQFLGGMYVVIADAAAPSTNAMVAQVTSYNPTTGELVANVLYVRGSGTIASWLISLSAPVPDIAAEIHGAPEQNAPGDTDEISIWDTVSGLLRKITLAVLKKFILQNSKGINLCVNGACTIDQVNAGALNTPVNLSYPIDNWQIILGAASKLQTQQVPSSSSMFGSLGATNALKFSVLASYTALSTEQFNSRIPIEGLNWARLQWGTANARPISLQLKVRADTAGTYSGSIQNAAANRSYPFSFNVVAGDNLIKIENIPGDTAGTWPTTNVTGAYVSLDLGSGSNFKSTANSWQAGNFVGVTGAVAFAAQANASTLSVTDVQVNDGVFCKEFERKLVDKDFIECQRYRPGFKSSSTSSVLPGSGIASSTTFSDINIPFKVPARIPPTGFLTSSAAHLYLSDSVSGIPVITITPVISSVDSMRLSLGVTSGLTQYRPYFAHFINANGYLVLTGAEI